MLKFNSDGKVFAAVVTPVVDFGVAKMYLYIYIFITDFDAAFWNIPFDAEDKHI